jgi:hypothetical protein
LVNPKTPSELEEERVVENVFEIERTREIISGRIGIEGSEKVDEET